MAFIHSPKVVTNGLALYLDAANRNSYPRTGTTWTDLTGNGYNGTLTNGPTFSGTNGGVIVFDGSDDFSTSGTLGGSFASFSVVIWFFPTSVISYRNVMDCNFNYNATTGNIGPRLEMNSSGNLTWIYSNITNDNNSFYTHNVVSSGLAANTWHCVGITYNGGSNTSTTYYNGNATGLTRGSFGTPTGFVGVMNNVILGKGFFLDASRLYAGRISSAIIYNRALTATEVLQNYNAIKTRLGL